MTTPFKTHYEIFAALVAGKTIEHKGGNCITLHQDSRGLRYHDMSSASPSVLNLPGEWHVKPRKLDTVEALQRLQRGESIRAMDGRIYRRAEFLEYQDDVGCWGASSLSLETFLHSPWYEVES